MSYAFDEIRLNEEPGGTVVTLVFKDKLTVADFEHFVSQVEKIMESRDKIRLLILLNDFKGWTAGALWEDIKFGIRHFNDVERLAIVGDKEWERTMAAFISPFTGAEVRYFDMMEMDQAESWIGSIRNGQGYHHRILQQLGQDKRTAGKRTVKFRIFVCDNS